MVFYLTYNDNPSGIYSGQVIDVCRYWKEEMGINVRLMALISFRNFSANKKKILQQMPDAIVWPMFPRPRWWRVNVIPLFFLFLFSSRKQVVARGAFATALAQKLRSLGLVKKVVFDARGAYHAELSEYDVAGDKKITAEMERIERRALYGSDGHMAVSNKLVEYWKEHYGFEPKNTVVVPCTLDRHFLSAFPEEANLEELRAKAGFSKEDIVVVYSGSSAGWQSFDMVDDLLYQLMSTQPQIKVLFLAPALPKRSKALIAFESRFLCKWVEPSQVPGLLMAGDFGLLLREVSVTNKVASPVKFAEYLSCGLKVLISAGVGDFSDYVNKKGCGAVLENKLPSGLRRPSHADKRAINELAFTTYTKQCYKEVYRRLLG